jgi:hypothetical protein
MYKHLMKLPDVSSAAMQRGNAIHKLAEDFVKLPPVKGGKLPAELVNMKEELTHLREHGAIVEQAWGFNAQWAWTGRAGWFGDDVWLRAKADAVVV